MDTKSKILSKGNSKLKVISLISIFFNISLLFELIFNLIYSLSGFIRSYSIAKYYLVGNVISLTRHQLINYHRFMAVVSFILLLISLVLYKFNKKSEVKIFDNISKFLSNISIELIILLLSFIAFMRFIEWNSTLDFYDSGLVSFNFIIIFMSYLSISSFKYNKNILSRLITYNMFLDAIKNINKKTLSKKIVYMFMLSILIQCAFALIILYIIYNVPIYNYTFFIPYYVIPCFFIIISIIGYSYCYNMISKKLDYIEYISKSIKTVEDGNLNYKLDIVGNDEISSIASSINNMTNGLENALDEKLKSEKLKTELITNVSHDLKTPLTSIVSYVDILKNNELDDETAKTYINILDKKSKRLKVLVEDIFEASKINSGDIEINISETDIKELLVQSIVEFDDKIEISKLDFVLTLPDEALLVNIDGDKMFRVFENLISNVLKYSLKNTRVYIDIYTDEDGLYITIKNISNHKLNISSDELMERFVRGDVSRYTEGSGLGLSIAKNLIELQGGKFNLDIDGDLFKTTVYLNKLKNSV